MKFKKDKGNVIECDENKTLIIGIEQVDNNELKIAGIQLN